MKVLNVSTIGRLSNPRGWRPRGRHARYLSRLGAVLAIVGGLLIVPSGALAAPTARSAKPSACSALFPSARSTTSGGVTRYNFQQSVRMVVCDRFGQDGAHFGITAGMVCGLVSTTVGARFAKTGAAVDGVCSGTALASSPSIVTGIAMACSWAADLLGIPLKAAGTIGGIGCAAAPEIGSYLGTWAESKHERDIARDVIRKKRCIKLTHNRFGWWWSAPTCLAGDRGFSDLPGPSNNPNTTPPPPPPTDPTPSSPAPDETSDAGSVPPGTRPETVGGVTHTWTNFANAGGIQGPSIQTGQTVGVVCKTQGFRVANGNTWWYKIGSSPWNGAYYASADAFYNNGATFGSLLGTPWVDPAVPDCAAPIPPPMSTWTETVGGVTHTWTNYTNAGGAQGPSIPTGQTVQIACKVPGFRVADGNTWWYRIASSPWNGAYYASADAFYNNGATSGSLIGTPFVDNGVANC